MRFIILFLFCNVIVYGQEIKGFSTHEIYYTVKFRKDTTNANQFYEETLSLLIGDKISLFKSTQKAIYDSLTTAAFDKNIGDAKGGPAIIDFSKIRNSVFKPEIFKSADDVVGYNELLKTVYEYPVTEKIIWKITNEKKVIEGFNCKKANGKYNNRKYEAWFTEEIPISEGPYVFKGLPGLILEVFDSKDLYHFKFIGLKKIKKPIVPTQSQIKTERSKFVKTRLNFLADPIGVFENQSRLKIPEHHRERVTKMHQSNNNFID